VIENDIEIARSKTWFNSRMVLQCHR